MQVLTSADVDTALSAVSFSADAVSEVSGGAGNVEARKLKPDTEGSGAVVGAAAGGSSFVALALAVAVVEAEAPGDKKEKPLLALTLAPSSSAEAATGCVSSCSFLLSGILEEPPLISKPPNMIQ